MLAKLFGQRPAATGRGVDGVIDGDLAILVVEPSVDVLAALLQDLLTKDD